MYLTHFSFRIEHTDKKVHYIKTATKTPSSLHCSHLASMQYGLICIHFHNIVDFLFLSVLRLNSYLVMYLVKWNVFLWTIIHFLTVLFINNNPSSSYWSSKSYKSFKWFPNLALRLDFLANHFLAYSPVPTLFANTRALFLPRVIH